jgi:hypothetical protein
MRGQVSDEWGLTVRPVAAYDARKEASGLLVLSRLNGVQIGGVRNGSPSVCWAC